ncbi:uncharacterized protein C9orf85 homolog isoform X2 [Amia ocellicauda]|uniref:uncharacterized protein C9orf85 homolog isoform X2 n=1 Tax=Amia ocellicauda TaxID=2972642 RepID=UPI00346477EE
MAVKLSTRDAKVFQSCILIHLSVTRANAKVHDGVCQRCKDVLEWKVKFNKYKPLVQPKTCVKCLQKSVRDAYHVICKPCALSLELCAKCGKKEDIVIPLGAEQQTNECEVQDVCPRRDRQRRKEEEEDNDSDFDLDGDLDSDSDRDIIANPNLKEQPTEQQKSASPITTGQKKLESQLELLDTDPDKDSVPDISSVKIN